MNENYAQKTTEWLVGRLENDGVYLDFGIVTELAKRPECVPLLRETLAHRYDRGDGWAAIHAVHLLGLIKTADSLDALIYALVNRQEALSDWLCEDMPGLLAGFGPEALPKLEQVVNIEFLDVYAKAVAIGAIGAIGWRYKDSRPRVVSFLSEIVEKGNDAYLVANAICALADMHEQSVIPLIEKAYAEKRVDTELIDKETAVELAFGATIWGYEEHDATFKRCANYFTEENFAKFLANSPPPAREPKVGRNDPCPCGSGKKYKKCCLLKKMGITR